MHPLNPVWEQIKTLTKLWAIYQLSKPIKLCYDGSILYNCEEQDETDKAFCDFIRYSYMTAQKEMHKAMIERRGQVGR